MQISHSRAFATYFMICHIKMSIGKKIDSSFETNDLKLGIQNFHSINVNNSFPEGW